MRLGSSTLERQEGAALRCLGRINSSGGVLPDPLGSPARGLIGARLVLTDRHRRAAVATAKARVADKSWDPADELPHLIAALLEKIEQLGSARACIAANDDVHRALLSDNGQWETLRDLA